MRDSIKLKLKSVKGNTLKEESSGDDFSTSHGKYMQKQRIIDHEKDLYEEVVVDPKTAKIVHSCKEPLSEHRGHGSAKKKKASNRSRR